MSGPVSSRRAPLRSEVLTATVVGIATGFGVAAIHEIVFHTWVLLSKERDWWLVAFLPPVGLAGAWAIRRLGHDGSTATTERYIQVFHTPGGTMGMRQAPKRLGAALLTICTGGAMGLEGPSIYLGAVIGDWAGWRLGDRSGLQAADRTILIAGAAAGIAAVFKAPLTGIIFALEVPYRDDLARRALIPAIFAAAAGYLASVSVIGTTPLFFVRKVNLGFPDLAASLLVGMVCGLAARLFVYLVGKADAPERGRRAFSVALAGGAVLAVIGLVSFFAFGHPLGLGPGYDAIAVATGSSLSAWMLVLLVVLRMIATPATVAGGGVGGLFFPIVAIGAGIGGVVGHLIPGTPSLHAVVGIAAFLGGAYKVPLAGVAFVAETTGAPGYVIPGLLGAALGYLLSGDDSVSHAQLRRTSPQ